MDYLLGLLNPGGHLVFTTRGRFHIDWLTNIDQHMNGQHEVLKSYFAELKAMAPPDQIKQRYENGEFQFYRLAAVPYWRQHFTGKRLFHAHISSNTSDQRLSIFETTSKR